MTGPKPTPEDVDEAHVLDARGAWDGSFVRYSAPHQAPGAAVLCDGSRAEVERGGEGSIAAL